MLTSHVEPWCPHGVPSHAGLEPCAIVERPRKPKKVCKHVCSPNCDTNAASRFSLSSKIAGKTIRTFCTLPDWCVCCFFLCGRIAYSARHRRSPNPPSQATWPRTGDQELDVLSSSRPVSETPAVPNPRESSTSGLRVGRGNEK